MKRKYRRSIFLALIAAPVAALLLLPAHGNSLSKQENKEGPVRVSVTPQDLSKSAAVWRFAVQFDTHEVSLSQDMVAASSLSGGGGGGGAGMKPTAWEGDPPGGHHRRGVLVFKPIEPLPATITLHIREVGNIAERTFTWNLADAE